VNNHKIVKGFLSKEEAKQWADYVISNEEDHPFDNYTTFILEHHEGHFDTANKLADLNKIAYEWLSKRYKLKELRFDRSHGTLMYPGSSLRPHRDVKPPGLNKGQKSPYLLREGYEYACLLYLTDDYVGGDLVFVDENISFHLEAGDAIIFPNCLVRHEVTKIESGIRVLILNHFFGESPE
jgi:hypothetical protein